MKNQWNQFKLGGILTLEYGKGLPESKRISGDYPVYGSAGIIGYHNEPLIKGPGIIVGRKGSIGSVFYEKKDFYPIDTVFYVQLKSSDFNLRFVYYLLKQLNLSELNTDAAVPGLNKRVAQAQFVNVPDYLTQQKIAAILSAYDDLIENNTRRIQILEEMAQRIYQKWFVNFRFPGHEKVKFIDSELGKIPEGWKVDHITNFVNFERGVEPGSNNYEKICTKENIPFIRVGDLGNRSSEIFIKRSLTKDKILNKGDIVISMDGTPGIVKIGLFGCYSSGIRKLVIKNELMKRSFLYFLMKSEHIQSIIKTHSKGTTILHASESIENMHFVLPEEKFIEAFDNKVGPTINEFLLLEEKNKLLRETRDLLLPKLISGELDVSNLDITVKNGI